MKLKILVIAISVMVPLKVFANYEVKLFLDSAQDSINMVEWNTTAPSYTSWVENGSNFNCSIWNPNENTITIGQSFQQSRDCSVNEERFRQERSLSDTGNYRNEGEPVLEERVSPRTETNQSIGTLETWILTSPTYSSWVNSGGIYGCSNWSPNPNTVTINQSFTQTATDCEQNQIRDRQDIEKETTTNAIRNSGSVVVENQTLTSQTNSRTATGTLETWISTIPTYTSWVNSGGIYGCNTWTPDPSTVNSGTGFTQTSSDCELNQTRNRQEREIETTTNAIRNNGSIVVENQTLTGQTSSRAATGTKVVAVCMYSGLQYIWSTGNTSYVSWAGTTIASNYSGTSIAKSGYLYTRGAYMGAASNISQYQVCRQPL